VYRQYAAHFDSAMAALTAETKRNAAFAAALQECHSSPECGHGLTLGSYLLEPIQRIPRCVNLQTPSLVLLISCFVFDFDFDFDFDFLFV
jgi:hypothetical protein